jgi:bifunctional non-homologous end joining protein LigD
MPRARPAPPRLGTYVAKRDFAATPEPSGAKRAAREKAAGGDHGLYVVQKHAASRLHYDFRLEHDGVLLSWAVPKQPSKNPRDRRLAVQVEDHPLDYAKFEGVIPEGNYGAGKVEIWDRGRWAPKGDVSRALAQGRLNFQLFGGRLAGDWHLVRLTPRDPAEKRRGARNWLLFRGRSGKSHSSKDPVLRVRHGRTKAAQAAPEPAAAAPRNAAAAGQFELATLVDEPPPGKEWIHETKWDGYRMLAAVQGGRASLWSRSGGDWSDRLPELAEALAALPVKDAVVDGEVVSLAAGRSSFQSLQAALGESPGSRARRSLRFVAFDLLAHNGEDLRALPLLERKRHLQTLLDRRPKGSLLLSSPHRVGRGEERYARACKRGLEGIVSKRADAPYRAGRGRDWLKVKCRARQEFVIAGYTHGRSAAGVERDEVGALLLATRETRKPGALVYAGRVGTGFDQRTRLELFRRLRRAEVRAPSVAGAPASREARWVRPDLVAEVEFVEWTSDGRLRHPVFVALREDKPASAVRRELPAATGAATEEAMNEGPATKPKRQRRSAAKTEPEVAGVRITHPERLLFPGSDLTKLDLARYFEAAWPYLEPHLAGRPLAFVRCPEGARAQCFFQKHWPETVAGIEPVDISEPGEKEPPHALISALSGLVALAQRGVIEIHLWGSRSRALEKPDRLVFDLDPADDVPWREVVAGARLLRSLLEELGLESFVLATGGKGVHVVAPLAPRADWATVRAVAAAIARALEAGAPERYIAQASKKARSGKIFVDYLRNGRGATAIAPYSPRARAGGPVAAPIGWDELARTRPAKFTIENVLRRAARDPWSGYFALKQSISKAALARLATGDASPAEGSPAALSDPDKKGKRQMATRKKASSKRYGDKAAEKVERAMHEMKRGKLRSGRSGKKVTSRKQAIAIGLSEAREAGGKVPPAQRSTRQRSPKAPRKK